MTDTDPRRTRLLRAAAGLALTLVVAACGEDAEGGADEEDTLRLGTEAEIEFYPIDGGTEPQGPGTVAVTDVREGTIDDLTGAGLQLDPEELESTPYYVDVRFENTGDTAVDLRDPGAEDQDGNAIPSLTIIDLGDAPPYRFCPAVPDTLAAGRTVEACAIILAPAGREIERIYFLPGGSEGFLYWETGL